MILDGWKKLIIALAGVASFVTLALAGHLSGLEAAAGISAIVLGHNVAQAVVDRTRPAPVRPEKRKPSPFTEEQMEAIRQVTGGKDS